MQCGACGGGLIRACGAELGVCSCLRTTIDYGVICYSCVFVSLFLVLLLLLSVIYLLLFI